MSRPVPSRRRSMRRYIPPQHGAWAMLLVPYLVGLLTAGFRWPDLPLFGAWLSGYVFSYFAFQSIKTRRPSRVRAQLLWYGLITVVLAVPVLLARPRVLFFAPAYVLLLAINGWYALRRRERALPNDLASVVQSCLMIPVIAVIAEVPADRVFVPFLLVLLYFTGTVLYVKTMIRERGVVAYRRASVGYHLVAFAAASLTGVGSALIFVLLLARAWLLPGRPLSPKQVGLIEIGASVLVLTVAALAMP
ncbi:YwiC-like family protein [Actinoplanes sp. NPDC024001]|uniref:YwiC-like family protein n=1 Tax=unclassified Actinoplanes TaxID=2626549 RepID=UPI002E20DD46